MKALTPKTRSDRSRKRQALYAELTIWLQREKDIEGLTTEAPAQFSWQKKVGTSDAEGIAEKLTFVRQEQAKLRAALHKLDIGFRRQRAWSQGKLLY
jgi:hypothetical protein